MSKISVIIPVYNVEPYIRECLHSVQHQTHSDIEVILVNDGSTDGSGAICDEYAARDARFIVVHKENGGVSSARNAGLDIATGEYIGFIDPDDYVTVDFYEMLLAAAVEHSADFALAPALLIYACYCSSAAIFAKARSSSVVSSSYGSLATATRPLMVGFSAVVEYGF